MTQPPQQSSSGWYPDPDGTGAERWWDGNQWTTNTRDPQPLPMTATKDETPIWKKWWAWAISGVVLLGIIGTIGGNGSSATPQPTITVTATATETTTITATATQTKTVEPTATATATVTITVTETPASAKNQENAPLPVAQAPAPPPPPKEAPGTANTYYQNCTAVRNAGKAPLYRGDPGYRAGLDRDNDGVACE